MSAPALELGSRVKEAVTKVAAPRHLAIVRVTHWMFVLFPAILWTGLAMSFGITSVFPILVTSLGGHQSARTLHFVFVMLLMLFAIVHISMLVLAGFWRNVRAMITGHMPQEGKPR